MNILTSLIGLIKTTNIALVVLTIMISISAFVFVTLNVFPEGAFAQEPGGAQETSAGETVSGAKAEYFGLGLLAAAISTCVSAIAAGVAVAIVGSAAMGAVAERPEVMGRSIIFVGLAEGIAIYGLIISIMILGKL